MCCCLKFIQYITRANISFDPHTLDIKGLDFTDTEDNDDNDDLFLSSASRGTSPVDSGNNGNKVVYELDSDGSDEVEEAEEPAESAQAELSMQAASHYSMLLTFYSQIISQRIGLHQSTSSSDGPPILNMSTTTESTTLNVRPPTARKSMAMMCIASWIQVTQSQLAVCVGMQRCVGATKQSVLLTIQRT
jgi:hypothetical protein